MIVARDIDEGTGRTTEPSGYLFGSFNCRRVCREANQGDGLEWIRRGLQIEEEVYLSPSHSDGAISTGL